MPDPKAPTSATAPNTMRLRLIIAALVIAHVVGLAVMLVTLPADVGGHFVAADALRYTQIGLTPGPYVDHEVEIPPVEVLTLQAVASADVRTTAVRNAVLQSVLAMVVAWAVALGWGPVTAAAYLALSLLLTPFLAFRLDLLSVALAVLGLALSRREAPRAGGVLLGIGILTKLWPAGIAVALFAARRSKALVWMIGAALTGTGAWLLWSPGGPAQVLGFRDAVGWQIESSVGAVRLALTTDPVIFESGANRIGAMSFGLRAVMGIALIATIGFVALIARRSTPTLTTAPAAGTDTSDVVVVLAVTSALLVFAPILSWQYVSWLLPWIAIAAVSGRTAIAISGVVGVGLTAWLVFLGIDLTERRPIAVWVLLARNAALVAILVACVASLWRRRNPVGDSSHASEPARG